MRIFVSLSGHLLVLHAALTQGGVHEGEVPGGHTDVHIDVDSHQLRAVRAPEVHLQVAPKPNT